MPPPVRRAVFLDRDGTLNVEKNYVYRIQDLEFIPGAIEAVRLLNLADWRVVVVSNQSGVARGLYTTADVERLHGHMRETLADRGARVDAFYFCPHHPDGSVEAYRRVCACRKPNTGMIDQAQKALDLDLRSSYIVGDLMSDMELGRRAGLKTALVRTGYGANTIEEIKRSGFQVDIVADDLLGAVHRILERRT